MSLVTRIASKTGALDNQNVVYISTAFIEIYRNVVYISTLRVEM
jgi:hypothetical protein